VGFIKFCNAELNQMSLEWTRLAMMTVIIIKIQVCDLHISK